MACLLTCPRGSRVSGLRAEERLIMRCLPLWETKGKWMREVNGEGEGVQVVALLDDPANVRRVGELVVNQHA